jgi:hypothetical protein
MFRTLDRNFDVDVAQSLARASQKRGGAAVELRQPFASPTAVRTHRGEYQDARRSSNSRTS